MKLKLSVHNKSENNCPQFEILSPLLCQVGNWDTFCCLCLLWVAEFHSIAWQDCSNFKLHFHILCDSGFWMLNSIFIVMVTQQPKPLICFPRLYYDERGKNTRDTRWEHDFNFTLVTLVIDTVTINKTDENIWNIFRFLDCWFIGWTFGGTIWFWQHSWAASPRC